MAIPDFITGNSLFYEMLKSHRREMTPAARKRNPTIKVKGKVWLYPHAIERQYKRLISKTLQEQIDFAMFVLETSLQRWINEFKVDGAMRLDAFTDELMAAQKELRNTQAGMVNPKSNLAAAILNVGYDVDVFNRKQWNKFAKIAIGTPFITNELWVAETMGVWQEANMTLVKSLSDEYIKKMSGIVSEGVQSGTMYTEVTQSIRKLNKNITGPRARLLARDQIGKLNGRLTQRRQTDAGIEAYEWITAGDERVRGAPGPFRNAIPSHYIMNGMLCRWDKNNVYSSDKGKTWKARTAKMPRTTPGLAIQCRCVSIPFFNKLVEQADKELSAEAVI